MTTPVIYCDASVPHPDKARRVAGWGAVIIRGNRIVEASGALPWPDNGQTSLAEIGAALEALLFALGNRLVRDGETVFIASDCDTVELYLSGKPRRPRADFLALSGRIRRHATKHRLTLIAAHVKGHNGGQNGCNFDLNPHSRHNTRADQLAKVAAGVIMSPEARARHRDENNRAERLASALAKRRRWRLHRDQQFAAMAADL